MDNKKPTLGGLSIYLNICITAKINTPNQPYDNQDGSDTFNAAISIKTHAKTNTKTCHVIILKYL